MVADLLVDYLPLVGCDAVEHEYNSAAAQDGVAEVAVDMFAGAAVVAVVFVSVVVDSARVGVFVAVSENFAACAGGGAVPVSVVAEHAVAAFAAAAEAVAAVVAEAVAVVAEVAAVVAEAAAVVVVVAEAVGVVAETLAVVA